MFKTSRTVVLQIAGFALALGVAAFLAHHFDLAHVLGRMQQRLGKMEWYGALLYPLLVAACNLLLLPGSVLTLGSGLFFGLWWGSFLVLCGNVLGAAVAFGIGRLLGRTWVEKRILGTAKWARLDRAISCEGWKIIFLSQVHPFFPTSLLNYFYGITRIRFRTCILWIALAQFPGIFLYAYLGTLAQLGIKLYQHKNHPQPHEYVVWIGGLLLTAVVTAGIGRIALRMLGEAGDDQQKDVAGLSGGGGGSDAKDREGGGDSRGLVGGRDRKDTKEAGMRTANGAPQTGARPERRAASTATAEV